MQELFSRTQHRCQLSLFDSRVRLLPARCLTHSYQDADPDAISSMKTSKRHRGRSSARCCDYDALSTRCTRDTRLVSRSGGGACLSRETLESFFDVSVTCSAHREASTIKPINICTSTIVRGDDIAFATCIYSSALRATISATLSFIPKRKAYQDASHVFDRNLCHSIVIIMDASDSMFHSPTHSRIILTVAFTQHSGARKYIAHRK